MVSITLTPDNANERRPRNVVHLIVAEGVTEIPEYLFEETKQLETIVFSKSVTIIGSLAFYWCINLRSVIFPNPNDSQLREIGFKAFSGCKSLKSIAIPDSVTTIGECAFQSCTNLESVLFSDQSCLQEIERGAFHSCHSLQSIIIPKSVTTIKVFAFQECLKLKSVIFAEHSSIQTIKPYTFSQCTSLQFINIPITVITIDEHSFALCPVLQVIDIPHQAEGHPDAFNDCKLLSTILEEHGTDCIKGRFDELSIHQTCYNFKDTIAINSIIDYFHSLQDNDPDLLQVDIMGMTPLHILCANPEVTKDMIKQLYRKNTEAASIRISNDMLPWHMYAVNKDKQLCMLYEADSRYATMNDTARMIMSNELNVDALVDANLDIDIDMNHMHCSWAYSCLHH